MKAQAVTSKGNPQLKTSADTGMELALLTREQGASGHIDVS